MPRRRPLPLPDRQLALSRKPPGAKALIIMSDLDAGLKASSSTVLLGQSFSSFCSLHPRQLHPCHAPREAGLAHGLEHLAHLGILAQQLVDFLYAGAGAAGDA